MKSKSLLVFVVLSLLVVFSNGAFALTEDMSIVLTTQSPYPVEPGQVVSIEVSLQNNGYGEAQNIILEIMPKSPFTLLPGEEKIKTFSRIPARDHVTASYKLYVDKNAISNNYEIEFSSYQTGSDVQKTDKILVQVQGRPKFVVERIETYPANIEPGDTVTLNATIKNVGTGSASSMETVLVSNTTYIVPVLSGGLYYLGTINAGETKEASFQMSIDNAAEYTTYPSVVILSYNDESGTPASDSFYIGIPVRGKPIIDILSAKIDGSDFKVDIENIGTANAKALKILLVQGGKTTDSAIANELRPTKSKTIRFTSFDYGQATVNISYLDESNQFFSAEYPVNIIQASAASNQSGENGLSPLLPVLIVVVVLESYYVWRLRKKSKK